MIEVSFPTKHLDLLSNHLDEVNSENAVDDPQVFFVDEAMQEEKVFQINSTTRMMKMPSLLKNDLIIYQKLNLAEPRANDVREFFPIV